LLDCEHVIVDHPAARSGVLGEKNTDTGRVEVSHGFGVRRGQSRAAMTPSLP